MVWEPKHIKRGVKVFKSGRPPATIVQCSWDLSDDLDSFMLVEPARSIAMPNARTRTEMAAYLNKNEFFEK